VDGEDLEGIVDPVVVDEVVVELVEVMREVRQQEQERGEEARRTFRVQQSYLHLKRSKPLLIEVTEPDLAVNIMRNEFIDKIESHWPSVATDSGI
jgi:hypothetical protein